MKHRVVLVTGAGRGSGEDIAKKFLSAGDIVVATDLEAPSWEYENQDGNLLRFAMDVGNEKEIVSVISKVNSLTEGISILVNNAGISNGGGSLLNCTSERFDKLYAVNLRGCFLTMREVAKKLISEKKGGAFINVASIAGKNGFADTSLYGATKAGVIGLTRCLAIELGPYDITVNAICPGSVDTPMLAGLFKRRAEAQNITIEEAKHQMALTIPMQRLQQPEDLGELVYFLASKGARNISGESINLDGGVVRD